MTEPEPSPTAAADHERPRPGTAEPAADPPEAEDYTYDLAHEAPDAPLPPIGAAQREVAAPPVNVEPEGDHSYDEAHDLAHGWR